MTANNQTNRPRGGGFMRGPGGGPPGMSSGEKAKDFKSSIKNLVGYLAVYKFKLLAVVLFAVFSTVFMIVGPKILAKATTELFRGLMSMIAGGDGIDFAYIAHIMFILIVLYVISSLFSYIQGYLMTDVSMKVTYNLRKQIMAKIDRIPLNYFDKTNYGEVLSRVTNDVDMLSQSLNQSITQLITSATTIIGVLIMMLTISLTLTLVALCIIPISMLLVMQIIKRSQKHFKDQQNYLGHINGHVEEMYGGHIVMKAFNGEKKSVERFDGYNETLYHSAWKSQFLSGLVMPIMNFIGNLGYVVICILGGWLASNGSITVGSIQAFIQYVRSFTQPITQIANISNILQQTAAAAERVFEFLAENEEPADTQNYVIANSENKDNPNALKIEGNVEFKNVKFGYTPEKTIIHDFSAAIKQGQKVALVGPTGAGKTTIVKLLMRFYDIDSGQILLDGHDIHDFSRDDLRSVFGMVLQDTWLYNGTIRDNIRYGKLDATDEEVEAAAKAAQVDHFVRTLPNSYDMELNEEASNVSQGQKQLLTIARAILADPKVLILDEATSSVDTRTEILIQKAMDKLMEGRTSFVIAHRLSTIRNADLILCINDGDIVEQGTHEELMAKGGFYAKLYNSQFEKISA
ncbi:MAG: ABC transporter ATP-binding protein [Anaerofustis sp.]